MAATLVNDVKDLFQHRALSEAATELGEPEGSVMRGFQTASAAIFSGLAGQAGQLGFVRQTFNLITEPLNDPHILTDPLGLFGPAHENRWLHR